ncbi:hypothetical protein ACWS7L_07610 [Exiguobacterium artemiae]
MARPTRRIKYRGTQPRLFSRYEEKQYIVLYIPDATQHETQRLIKDGWRPLRL